MKMLASIATLAAALCLAAGKPQFPDRRGPPPAGPGFGGPGFSGPGAPPFGARPFTPVGSGQFTPIVSQNFDLNGVDGSYQFGYESADGSTRQEQGVVNNPGTPVEAMSVTGSYSYVGADGVPVTVNYIADENGFQPIGNVVHPAIQRAVADQVAFARSQPPPPPGAFGPGPAAGGRFPPPPPRPF